MSSFDPSSSPARAVSVAAAIAFMALAVVVRYGFEAPRPDTAARPQASSAAQAGDRAAEAAIVELARDARVVALVREPAFPAAARAMRLNPELARLIAENDPAAVAVTAPEIAQVMERNALGIEATRRASEAAQAALTSTEAQKILARYPAVNRYANWLVEMSKVAPWRSDLDQPSATRLPALNAAFAGRFAGHSAAAAEEVDANPGLEKEAQSSPDMKAFLRARAEAAPLAVPYASAADALAASRPVVELAARNAAAVQRPMTRVDAARALQDADAVELLRAHPDAVRTLLASPGARRLLENPVAAPAALGAGPAAGKQ